MSDDMGRRFMRLEIERLRAENAKLRDALLKIRRLARGDGALDSRYAAIADNALAPEVKP
jgi:hypothetical protein